MVEGRMITVSISNQIGMVTFNIYPSCESDLFGGVQSSLISSLYPKGSELDNT